MKEKREVAGCARPLKSDDVLAGASAAPGEQGFPTPVAPSEQGFPTPVILSERSESKNLTAGREGDPSTPGAHSAPLAQDDEEGEPPSDEPQPQCSPYQGELSPEWATEGVKPTSADPPVFNPLSLARLAASSAAPPERGSTEAPADSPAPVAGLGVDIVEIERMEAVLRRSPAFARRVFSDDERSYCERRRRPAAHYATHFAAKEAVLKALGTGFSEGIGVRDVEVAHGAKGKPVALLHGRAAQVAAAQGVLSVHISLSRTHGTAVANAIAVTEATKPPAPRKDDAKAQLAAAFKELRSFLDDPQPQGFPTPVSPGEQCFPTPAAPGEQGFPTPVILSERSESKNLTAGREGDPSTPGAHSAPFAQDDEEGEHEGGR